MSAIDPTVTSNNADAIVVSETNQLSESYIDPSVFNPFHGEQPSANEEPETQAGLPPFNPIPRPFPPFPIARLAVSGRYRGVLGSFELELRVDVDRNRPLNKVSGDFFQIIGAVKNYYGSFVINTPTISYSSTLVNIEGLITGTFSASFPYVKISIPRNIIFLPAANATLSFFASATGAMGATYINVFESRFFRTVQYEQDNVAGITPFVSYNTGSLTSGGAARTLSVAGAYAECGIEMQNTGGTNIVSTASIGASWSDSELHTAMVNNFTSWADQPNWRVWLLEAMLHDIGPGLYGIMFDQQGRQRQGCAVFHTGIGGTTATQQRLQLYTYVHELGHSFNLLHSWQKHLGSPSIPSRPTSLSWMNYPWNNAFGNPANFWNNFAFQFDNEEVTHLRHAFRNNVIMGGSNFAVGSALYQHSDLSDFQDAIENNSGLNLRIEARNSYAFGEPVVVDLKLSTYDLRGKMVNARLHPNFDFVRIAIQKPNNEVVIYEPLMEHLALADIKTIGTDTPAIYESAYIGFGKSGFTFDQMGFYTVKAVYLSMDGSPVVSNEITLRVKSPVTASEDEIADLYLGNDQGYLFYLLGSDSDSLKNGNAALDLVIDKYPKNSLSSYASLVKGINASRNYKTITVDKDIKNINVRTSNESLNKIMIEQVVKHSKGNDGVDNITLNMAMRNMALCQKDAGNEVAATETLNEMVGIFEKKGLKSNIIDDIKAQANLI
jgi:hypothetical protein